MLHSIATARAMTRPKETRKDLQSILEKNFKFQKKRIKKALAEKVNKTEKRGGGVITMRQH